MERPILLFGMPRSGTSWLGKLLDSHPDTLYRHEPDTWKRMPIPRFPDCADSESYAGIVQSFVDDLPAIRAQRVAGRLPVFPKAYMSRAHTHALEASVHLARFGSRIHSDFPVLMHSSASAYTDRRLVWKSIASLGRMGVIMNALPDAVGIHLLRHPCGQIGSVLRGQSARNFSDNTPISEDYGIFNSVVDAPLGQTYDLSLPGLKALTPEERLAWRWVLINEKALRECRQSGRVLCLRYEDVCRDPLARIEDLFQFVGLNVVEQTRAFVSTSTSQSKDRYYSIFKDPETAATRWRDELEPAVIERIMAIVRQSRLAAYYAEDAIAAPETS